MNKKENSFDLALNFHRDNDYVIETKIIKGALSVTFPPCLIHEPKFDSVTYIYNPTQNGLDIYGDKHLEIVLPSYAVRIVTHIDILLETQKRKMDIRLLSKKVNDKFVEFNLIKEWNINCPNRGISYDTKLEGLLCRLYKKIATGLSENNLNQISDEATRCGVHKGWFFVRNLITSGELKKMLLVGVGRVAKTPVLTDVNGNRVCEVRLAVEEFRKVNGQRKKFTHFFNFEAWSTAADTIMNNAQVGDLIEIRKATPRNEQWTSKTTGNKHSKIVFRIDDFSFIRTNRQDRNENVNDFEEENDNE